MIKSSERLRSDVMLLAAAFGCGVLHHYLFYAKAWGVSYPLFVLVFYLYFYLVPRTESFRSRLSAVLLVPVLFIIALLKLWKENLPLFQWYTAAVITAYVVLNYMNIDAMIACNNIQRYEDTGEIDAAYLGSLSYEAVPYLLELKRLHPEVQGVDDALERFRVRLEHRQPESWTEFNLSVRRAGKALNVTQAD